MSIAADGTEQERQPAIVYDVTEQEIQHIVASNGTEQERKPIANSDDTEQERQPLIASGETEQVMQGVLSPDDPRPSAEVAEPEVTHEDTTSKGKNIKTFIKVVIIFTAKVSEININDGSGSSKLLCLIYERYCFRLANTINTCQTVNVRLTLFSWL